MRTFIRFFAIVWVLTLLASCGGKTVPPPPEPKASYAEKAIVLHFKADSQLNRFQNSPHALHLCIYQLANPNIMNQYAGDASGISQLVQCKKFDPSVTVTKKIVMQPDSEATYVLDRAQGTTYLALAAGYYHLDKEHAVRLVKIPVVEKSKGWFRKKITRHLGHLEVSFELGPEGLEIAGEH